MSDFWARKLGAAPATPSTPPTYRPPAPMNVPPSFGRPAVPAPIHHAYGAPQAQPEAPWNAQSARQTDRCPACGSNNYMSPGGKKRCFDCGYPVEQSTSGVISTTSSQGGQTATPAQQAAGYSDGFQPGIIVDRVPHD